MGLGLALIVVVTVFSYLSPRFLTLATFNSVAFQLPELGLLTLAMLMPIISGGINLAITFTANICGLTLAWMLHANGGPDASFLAFLLGSTLAIGVGTASGLLMGPVIAYTGAHPILVSLSMMIFLRGLGEFLTRGGDISGFPEFIQPLGHGSLFGVPIPLLILIDCRCHLAHFDVAHQVGLCHLHDRLEYRGDALFRKSIQSGCSS